MVKPRIVLLIFVSGKVVLTGLSPLHNRSLFRPVYIGRPIIKTAIPSKIVSSILGAKERQEIYDAFENIYPILKSFRKL